MASLSLGEGDRDCLIEVMVCEQLTFSLGEKCLVSCFQLCFMGMQGGKSRWELGSLPTAKTDQAENSSRLASQNHGAP